MVSLFLFFLSCQSPQCPEWEFQSITTPCYDASRIYLVPQNPVTGIEVEFVLGSCGLKGYLNVFACAIRPLPEDYSKARVAIIVDGESKEYIADLFEGGQRLLLPDEATEYLTVALLAEQSVVISFGFYRSEIPSADFNQVYPLLF